MSKTIRIEYYGMAGEGPTVKEAKADAGRKLQELVRDTGESPTIVRVGDVVALIAFQRYGWGWRLIQTEGGQVAAGRVHVSSGYQHREAEIGALRHVLDVAWSFPDDESDESFLLDALDGCGVHLSTSELAALKSEMLSRWGWQRSYRGARAQGYDDEDARYMASGLVHLTKAAQAQRAA